MQVLIFIQQNLYPQPAPRPSTGDSDGKGDRPLLCKQDFARPYLQGIQDSHRGSWSPHWLQVLSMHLQGSQLRGLGTEEIGRVT